MTFDTSFTEIMAFSLKFRQLLDYETLKYTVVICFVTYQIWEKFVWEKREKFTLKLKDFSLERLFLTIWMVENSIKMTIRNPILQATAALVANSSLGVKCVSAIVLLSYCLSYSETAIISLSVTPGEWTKLSNLKVVVCVMS